MADFVAGDRVHIANLGTGVIRRDRGRGWYEVELKGRSVVVAGANLELARGSRPRTTPSDTGAAPDARPAATVSLDLHGHAVATAIEALDVFLSDAILAGAADARVIHGRTGGRLKAAVHARLRQLPSVRQFRVDPANPGVTIVRF